jgi:hypothetical protein
MSYEFYDEVENIARELASHSHGLLASLLRKDIGQGFTSTEILMSLRHDIAPAVTDASVALPTRKRIKNLIKQIDIALAP